MCVYFFFSILNNINTLRPHLIGVLQEQGSTHLTVRASSALSTVSDNFQMNSAIFHFTHSGAKLSQTPNPAPAFKAVNPGLGPFTSVSLPHSLGNDCSKTLVIGVPKLLPPSGVAHRRS